MARDPLTGGARSDSTEWTNHAGASELQAGGTQRQYKFSRHHAEPRGALPYHHLVASTFSLFLPSVRSFVAVVADIFTLLSLYLLGGILEIVTRPCSSLHHLFQNAHVNSEVPPRGRPLFARYLRRGEARSGSSRNGAGRTTRRFQAWVYRVQGAV